MPVAKALQGLTAATIKQLSSHNKEPVWLVKKRLLSRQLAATKKCDLDINNLRVPLTSTNIISNSVSPQIPRKNLILASIDKSVHLHETLFRQYFDKLASYDQNAASDYNTAFFSSGAFLQIPSGVEIKKTLNLNSFINSPRINQFKRNLIILEDYSSVKIVSSGDAEYYPGINRNFETTELFIKKGAVCEFKIDQKWHTNVHVFYALNVFVENKGKILIKIEDTQASLFELSVNITLYGAKSKCEFVVLWHTGQNQKFSKTIMIDLKAPEAELNIQDGAISQNQSTQQSNYQINIGENAYYSKCDFVSKNLIVGNDAKITCRPEINSQNSRSQVNSSCQFLALNQDQEFYLQSRGFSDAVVHELFIKNMVK